MKNDPGFHSSAGVPEGHDWFHSKTPPVFPAKKKCYFRRSTRISQFPSPEQSLFVNLTE